MYLLKMGIAVFQLPTIDCGCTPLPHFYQFQLAETKGVDKIN
jgi:hypothetical protein